MQKSSRTRRQAGRNVYLVSMRLESVTSTEGEASEETSTWLVASTLQSVLETRPSAATMRATLQAQRAVHLLPCCTISHSDSSHCKQILRIATAWQNSQAPAVDAEVDTVICPSGDQKWSQEGCTGHCCAREPT